ncbi:permease-like cell division protein FtsX [Syntrophotalea acetylenica]|uniref:permease-like cell division protein FtsX n=1 Tax=Syntrophotalea acetylenica TaxID=29542 RepID=UPI002A35BC01|nr:permease-like cell division protein FtsX [Syntrophotalea acetylenica]MDY0262286.1 permease-like cell division protein FtsX [Syntrophotalea acetylenica]
MLQTIGYFIRRVGRNLRQTPVLCSAAIGTVAVALMIIAFFGIVVINVQQVARQWSREIQVVAYFDRVPDAGKLQGWKASLKNLEEVQQVHFVSREEAFKRFQKRLGDDADLLEGVERDFLPASLEIVLHEERRNKAGVEAVVARLRQIGELQDISYEPEWLERFDAFVGLLRVGGFVFGGFLLFAALFIVSNTIKLTLYARREEIEIMTLVGGTPLFIKMPFLLEGALQGLAGGLLALIGAWALFSLMLREGLHGVLVVAGVDGILFLSATQQAILAAGGLALGLVGSLLSLRKFVRI